MESLYIDGPAVVMVNGELVTSQGYIAWINYLFQEHYFQKNSNPWPLFEAIHEQIDTNLEKYCWDGFIQDLYGLIGYYEIKAVLTGTAAVEKEISKLIEHSEKNRKDGNINFFDFIKGLKVTVNKFHKESERGEEEQLSLVIEMMRSYYEQEKGSVIFVPEGPEFENTGLYYFGTPPRRRLKTNWTMMTREEKNNKARITFRRYMALLENRKLRKEVFGF